MKILVLHDQNGKSSGALTEMLESLSSDIREAVSLRDAEKLVQAEEFAADVIIIDEGSRDGGLLATLGKWKENERLGTVPTIALTATSSASEIIETMRMGALDHLSKPVDKAQLTAALKRAESKPRNAQLAENSFAGESFVGHCALMQTVQKLIGLAAACSTNVLVSGETGTGKSTVARAIFAHTVKPRGTLTVIECTAVPGDYESFVSISNKSSGTVILDEVGDLSLNTQGMLVRALKAFESAGDNHCRIVSTTQHDLIAMVQDKRFREDLYYRLNVLPIQLPALKTRGADILLLAEYFLQEASVGSPKSLSSAAAKVLLDAGWPGNVRQLRNLMHHLNVTVRSAVIEESDLTMIAGAGSNKEQKTTSSDDNLDYHQVLGTVEKDLLERALTKANGNRAEAARLLGINRQLFYSKLKAHGLDN